MEHTWENRLKDTARELGDPRNRSGLDAATQPWGLQIPPPRASIRWDHLIYAYMIENTRIYDITQKLVSLFLQGERYRYAESSDSAVAPQYRGTLLPKCPTLFHHCNRQLAPT